MFVRSRPNSPPRLDRFTILSSASYARASLAHAVDDLKAIEFFFFLLQQYSPSRVPFILFDSLSLKPFYITVEIFFFLPVPFHAFLHPRVHLFINTRQRDEVFQKAHQTPHHWIRDTVWNVRVVHHGILLRAWQYRVMYLRCNARRDPPSAFLRSFSTNARTRACFCTPPTDRRFFRGL